MTLLPVTPALGWKIKHVTSKKGHTGAQVLSYLE